jgi:AcrR family transcriptional regulator
VSKATPPTPAPQRRADAERNRLRIARAAREAFSERGGDVTIDEIAERAGVGVGTVYRAFPTKEALLESAILERVASIFDELRRMRAAERTAWEALARFLRFAARQEVRDRGFKQFIGGSGIATEQLQARREELLALLGEIVREAQADGDLRTDFAAGDIPLLLGGLTEASWSHLRRADEVVERYVAIVLAGLRSKDGPPLPGRPLGRGEIRELFSRRS